MRAWLRASMGREPLRCRERREAHYKIRNDACERKPLSAAELNQLFLAVDKNQSVKWMIFHEAKFDSELMKIMVRLVEALLHLINMHDLAVHDVFVVLRDQCNDEVE